MQDPAGTRFLDAWRQCYWRGEGSWWHWERWREEAVGSTWQRLSGEKEVRILLPYGKNKWNWQGHEHRERQGPAREGYWTTARSTRRATRREGLEG